MARLDDGPAVNSDGGTIAGLLYGGSWTAPESRTSDDLTPTGTCTLRGAKPMQGLSPWTSRESGSGMQVELLEDASLNDFLWEFARAELQNDSRQGRIYRRRLGSELFARVRSGVKEGLDRSERPLVRNTVLSTRPEYLRPLLRLGLRWSYGELPPQELSRLRVSDLNIFRPTAPSRLLQNFAAALDRGGPALWPPVAKNYCRMRPRFDPDRMVGVPIVIGTSRRGPFTIVEGLTRLSVLASRRLRGEPLPRGTHLLLGLGPKARDWWCF